MWGRAALRTPPDVGFPTTGWGHWDKKTLQRCWGHCGGKEPCKLEVGVSSSILAPSHLPMQGAQGNPALLPPPCTQTPRQKDKSS